MREQKHRSASVSISLNSLSVYTVKLTFIDGRVLKIDLFSNTCRSRQLPLTRVNP